MERMTSKERGARVEALAYAYAKDHEPEDEDITTAVIDMIADLCHLLETWGDTPQVIVEIALSHYNEECECQKPSDDDDRMAFWVAQDNDFFDNQEEM